VFLSLSVDPGIDSWILLRTSLNPPSLPLPRRSGGIDIGELITHSPVTEPQYGHSWSLDFSEILQLTSNSSSQAVHLRS
jgi:hypothetical protein